MKYLLLVLYVFFSVSGVALVKMGSSGDVALSITQSYLSVKVSWLTIVGLCFYVISFLLYMVLISKNDITYLIPITTALVFLATMATGVILFKESMNIWQIIGSAMIMFGVLIGNLAK